MSAVMTTAYPLPDIALVKELLGMLFDGMTVKPGPKLDASPKSGSFAGVYLGADGNPGALCCCDLAFAANSGAALSMLPPSVAKEALKGKELTPMMVSNLHEVMNICTRLMLRDDSPHLKLSEVCAASKLVPAAAAIAAAPKGRIDFEISIAKYGSGVLSVLSL